jgi:hypothetical protein
MGIDVEVIPVDAFLHAVVVVIVNHGEVAVGIPEQCEATLVEQIGRIWDRGACLKVVQHVPVVLLAVEEAAESLRGERGLSHLLFKDAFHGMPGVHFNDAAK